MVPNKIGVGIIGTGRRGYSLGMCIAELSEATDLEIRALCNRTRVRMKETQTALVEKYKQKNHFPSIALYEKYEDLIADSAVDLIMIITPQYVHREHALPALRSGKKVFLDKPIAHNLEDAIAIFQEEQKTHNPMIMGFTRRYEDPWIKTFELVKKGVIGDVHMMLVRNIIPYHTFFHTWHRRMEWSGGALADKMSHFFDVFNWFAESTPERLSAFGSRAVFLPEKNPPKRCRECNRDCPYRVGQKAQPHRQDEMVDFGDSRSKETELVKIHDTCVYLPGADINDHGLVSIVYPNGIKASLFWSVFGPDTEDQETFEIVGNKGKIVLIRHTGKIDIVSDYGKNHEIMDERKENFEDSHFGADYRLAIELDKFSKGKTPVVSGAEGLQAARVVEAVHRSVKEGGKLILMKDIENPS
jgi:predicted dehydrogenase